MSIVWSPVLVPSEDETVEEDEVMETGQAAGYPPIAQQVASAPEEDLWMEDHEGNAPIGEASIAPATEEEGDEVMEVGQADRYVPPEAQGMKTSLAAGCVLTTGYESAHTFYVSSEAQAMEASQVAGCTFAEASIVPSETQATGASHVDGALEEPYYSPGSPPEVASPEPLEQPRQEEDEEEEEEVATSGSEQPTWTEEGDITTDLEMLPRQPVYGMVLRPRRRNPNASIHANGGRSDPGRPRNRLHPRKASH